MIVVRHKRHEIVDLGTSPLFTGGEAKIFEFPNDPTMLAKIYDEPEKGDRVKRVSTLIDRPFSPIPPDVGGLAAPEEWLTDSSTGEFLGYSMQRVRDAKPILSIWSPLSADYRPFSVRYRIAGKLARLFIEFESHPNDIIFADIHSQNVLVDVNDAVWLIDLDSCQMTGIDGQVLISRMHTVDFLSPRLQGKNLSLMMRTRADERFAIGVLLYKLLMDGYHPNAARPIDAKRDVRDISERIRRGIWAYGKNPGNFLPPLNAPDFGLLPDKIRELFARCFEEGFNDPLRRPSAQEWFDAFTQGVNATTQPSPNVYLPPRITAILGPHPQGNVVWVAAGGSILTLMILAWVLVGGEKAIEDSILTRAEQDVRETGNTDGSGNMPDTKDLAKRPLEDAPQGRLESRPFPIAKGAPRPPLIQEFWPQDRPTPNVSGTMPAQPSNPPSNENLGTLGHLKRAFDSMSKDIKDFVTNGQSAHSSQKDQK